MRTISNTDDTIYSRDIIKRIEELQSEREDFESAIGEAETDEDAQDAREALATWEADEGKELAALEALAEECESYSSDWSYGETLIRHSYWKEYVQEMLEDFGDIPKNLPHYIEIDWEATARNIAMDYTTVDFDGVTYYIRSC